VTAYRPLHDGWTLTTLGGGDVPDPVADVAVPATVPGCVHTDLLAAGLIPDPFIDDNDVRLAWIGRADWAYETRFDWSPTGADRVDLACSGLDTVATVTLNGVEVGRTANMHRSYRLAVGDLLRPGENTLRVRLDSAYRYAEALRAELGERPAAFPQPFNFIRKMACNFGWDWGPTLVTAGIWQQIGLHAWSVARLESVRPVVTLADGDGHVAVHVTVERAAAEPLLLTAVVGGVCAQTTVAATDHTTVVRLTVADPTLWWPRGYGEPHRYPLTVVLSTLDARELDTWQRHIGFRGIRLDTAPDAAGSPFTVVVNDRPVFVRGVNWIPDDVFVTRVTRDRIQTRLRQAVEANVNFVRVWGGGRYESDDFYDLADELGLMVGQDFLFACAAYPEEEPLRAEVVAEAREQVGRLGPYPSLILWTGNNECLWGHADWGWREQLDGRSWGAGYYHDLLPAIVAELDPTRPYWPGSPYSGSAKRHPNDPAHGTTHIWDVWNTHDYRHYRNHAPRFVAEFGYQGPPAYATLRRAITDDPLTPESPGLAHHQKAADGGLKLARGLAAHLPVPRDFDDWHYLTQLNQARAIQLGVEHLRSLRPHCMGTVVWQLNDCWPVTSWAAIDSDGHAKPVWHALRRAYADRLLTIQPRGAGLALVAVNDGARRWTAQVIVRRLAHSGQPRANTVVEIDVPAAAAVTVPLPADLSTSEDPRAELLLAEAGGDRAWWFFAEDRDAALPTARYRATVEPATDGYRLTVTAVTMLRDVTLFPDRLDSTSTVDDALVTLLPGESATFTVTSRAHLDPDALTTRPVLRCVNDIPTAP